VGDEFDPPGLSVAPSGAYCLAVIIPGLAPWATIYRPSGAELHRYIPTLKML